MGIIELLKKLQERKGWRFARVINNRVTWFHTGQTIKEELLWRHHEPWPDGLYRVREATCDGGCKVGKPKSTCVKDGIYIKKQCACHMLMPVGDYSLKIDEMLEIFDDLLADWINMV